MTIPLKNVNLLVVLIVNVMKNSLIVIMAIPSIVIQIVTLMSARRVHNVKKRMSIIALTFIITLAIQDGRGCSHYLKMEILGKSASIHTTTIAMEKLIVLMKIVRGKKSNYRRYLLPK
ncbi:MAG: hypothetical protein QXE38_03715 [Candidatus Methanomethylicia archaeon]